MDSLPPKARRFRFLIRIGWILGIGLMVLVLLGVLLVAGLALESRWEETRTERYLLARGETLIPPAPAPIPDDQNFFVDPVWDELVDLVETPNETGTQLAPRLPKGQRQLDGLQRPLTETERATLAAEFPEFAALLAQKNRNGSRKAWKQAEKNTPSARSRAAEFILALQTPPTPVLSRLEELTLRPNAQLLFSSEGLASSMEQNHYLLNAASLLQYRALAKMETGDREGACQDVVTILKLAEHMGSQPLLIFQIVRGALAQIALTVIDQGIQNQVWIATELTQLLQAQIACALERHRLEHGEYPERLEELLPSDFSELPADGVPLQPVQYRKTKEGTFTLWSVGWNETDEGGTPGKTRSEGDWVWGKYFR
jgi:hypothetical protein